MEVSLEGGSGTALGVGRVGGLGEGLLIQRQKTAYIFFLLSAGRRGKGREHGEVQKIDQVKKYRSLSWKWGGG